MTNTQVTEPANHRGGHLLPGVEAGPGRRGEYAFRVDAREIGHRHGERTC
jgi:hypothetical protein